ncbi:hypothetical protein B7P43_G09893 [Cryptotermes secundus]|uniref:Ionotropic glutamate receptor L-glutamate and glycine-binding domain-containing protein n=1 Tax=Cryptotermes secundus TaxID=105785 RepID=A0A2J7PHJ7_9NEOP|nr:hypothetical protein B7P43_G09893 [Cryptotermes secundus]
MFRRFPTAIPRTECHPDDINCTVTYTGVDAFVLYSLARYLNFTPVIRQPLDGQEYGYATKNGTFMGAIGDIVYGKADISMNGIFIKPYGSDKILFTHNAYSDQVCIIVPKAKRMPKWLAVFGPLDSAVALSVLGLYTINVCFYFLINQTRRYYQSNLLESNITWSIILMEMFCPFVSLPLTRMPVVSSQRIFLGTCLIFGLVLTSVMKGMLVTGMTKPYYYPDINTLEELYASDLTIYTDSPSLMDTFGIPHLNRTFRMFDINPTMDGLSRRVQAVLSTVDFWGAIATERNAAAMARKSDYQFGVPQTKYQASDGSPLLHVVRECPRHYLLGYLMPRGSPYLSRVNDGIARLVEAGIVQHWKETMPSNGGIHDKFNVSHLREMVMNEENSKAFSLKDLQLAFYILAIGLFGSVIIFCFEMNARKKRLGELQDRSW